MTPLLEVSPDGECVTPGRLLTFLCLLVSVIDGALCHHRPPGSAR